MINKEFDMNIQMRETNFRWLTSQDLHVNPKIEFVRSIADVASKEQSIKVTLESTEADLDHCIVKAVHYHSSYLLAEVEADITVMKEC